MTGKLFMCDRCKATHLLRRSFCLGFCSFFASDFDQLVDFLLLCRMLNTGYSVQEIIEYFKTYVPVKERIARKFKEYQELTEKLKNGKKKTGNLHFRSGK